MAAALNAALFAVAILAILALGGRLRGLPREFPSRARLALACALLALVIYAAIAVPATHSAGGAEISIEELSFPALFAGHTVLVAFLAAWWRLRRPTSLTSFLYLRGAGVADVTGGLALGVRVWVITLGAALLIGLILQLLAAVASEGPLPAAELAEIPEVMLWMVDLPVAGKLLIVLVAMTVEEAFFRAFLQTRVGLVPSSVLFALAHASYGVPTMMIGVFVVSIIIGIDFARNRQLLRSILAHGVFDAIQLLIVVPLAVEQLQQL